jgi:hypothetical protein
MSDDDSSSSSSQADATMLSDEQLYKLQKQVRGLYSSLWCIRFLGLGIWRELHSHLANPSRRRTSPPPTRRTCSTLLRCAQWYA